MDKQEKIPSGDKIATRTEIFGKRREVIKKLLEKRKS